MSYGFAPEKKLRPQDVTTPGLYLLKCPGQPESLTIPIALIDGKLYAMTVAQVLALEGFSEEAYLDGPYK